MTKRHLEFRNTLKNFTKQQERIKMRLGIIKCSDCLRSKSAKTDFVCSNCVLSGGSQSHFIKNEQETNDTA